MSGLTINLLYFGTSMVALMLVCYLLYCTKRHIYKKVIINKVGGSNSINVQTKDEVIKMDPNVFENHISRIKANLIELNGQFSSETCDDILKHLKNSKTETNTFIIDNDVGKGDFCDIDARYKLVDDYIIKQHKNINEKIVNYDSVNSAESLEALKTKKSVVELLIDLDVILFLIRSSMCTKGQININSFDKMLLALYKANCKSNKTISHTIDNVNTDYITPLINFNQKEAFSDNDDNLNYVMGKNKPLILTSKLNRVGYDVDVDNRDPINQRLMLDNPNSNYDPVLALSRSNFSHSRNKQYKHAKLRKTKKIEEQKVNNSDPSLFLDPRQKNIVDTGSRTSLFQDSR